MITISHFLIFLLFSVYCQGQITNGDFENWKTLPTSAASQDPLGWTSSNPIVTYQHGFSAIEKSTDAYSGMYAHKIKQIFDNSAYVKANFITYNVCLYDSSSIKNKQISILNLIRCLTLPILSLVQFLFIIKR